MIMSKIDEAICGECGLCASMSTQPKESQIGFSSIKMVIIAPHPAKKSETGIDELVTDCVGKDMSSVHYTFLNRAFPYSDPISELGKSDISPHQQLLCSRYLLNELFDISEIDSTTPVILLGQKVFSFFFPSNDFYISIGKEMKFSIGDREFKMIPNYDPDQVRVVPQFLEKFKTNVTKYFNNLEDDSGSSVCLSLEEATQKLKEILFAYNQGKITEIVYDLETGAYSSWKGEILMVSFSTQLEEPGYWVPFKLSKEVHHSDLSYVVPEFHYDIVPQALARFKAILRIVLETIPLVGQNLKFDIVWSAYHDLCDVRKVVVKDDTQIMCYLSNQSSDIQFIDKSLKHQVRSTFNIRQDWENPIDEYMSKFKNAGERTYDKLPTIILGKYAGLDTFYNKKLYYHKIATFDPRLNRIKDVLNRASVMFSEAELKGVSVDENIRGYLTVQYNDFLKRKLDMILDGETVKRFIGDRLVPILEQNEKRKVNKRTKPWSDQTMLEMAFSITSPKDLAALMYGENYFKAPVNPLFVTKTGPSTSKDAIMAIIDRSDTPPEVKEFCTSLLEYKSIKKIVSTYLDSIHEDIDPKYGTYHQSFNITSTASGRLSSGFHILPSKSDIKRLYKSRWKGGVIGCFDFSQLELRLLAALANEPQWIEAYLRGEDLHAATAAIIYKKHISTVTKDERSVGKTINFAIAYQSGANSIAASLGISYDQAKSLLERFYSGVDKLSNWVTGQKEFVKKNGNIITRYGRIISIPQIFSRDKGIFASGERKSVNYDPQGTGSDIMVDCSLEFWQQELVAKKMKTSILGTVHDSVELDIYPTEIIDVVTNIKKYYEEYPLKANPWLTCPLVMDGDLGYSWGSAVGIDVIDSSPEFLKFSTSGPSKDILMLKMCLDEAHRTEIEITERKPLTDKDYKLDQLYRSPEKFSATISMWKK